MEESFGKNDFELQQEVSDVEHVADELEFLNDAAAKELPIPHDDVDLSKEDIYIPDDAENALLLGAVDNSDYWKQKLTQSRQALDQMKNGRDELSRYKRKIWHMKQKVLGLESEIAVHKNQIELSSQQMKTIQEEKEKCISDREETQKECARLESTIVSLRSIISSKNRDIASLERRLAETNRHLTLKTAEISLPNDDQLDNEELETLRSRVLELEGKLTQKETEEKQYEVIRLESLENFVGLIRTIVAAKDNEEKVQILKMNGGKCFHCGKELCDCVNVDSDLGCNYCSILQNLLKEKKPAVVNTEPDPFAFVIIFFIFVPILIALLAYIWSDELSAVLQVVKEKISSLFSWLVCFIPLVLEWMSSLSDSDYRSVVGPEYYRQIMGIEQKKIKIPQPDVTLTEWYVKQLQTQQNHFPNTYDQMLQFQKDSTLPRQPTVEQLPPPSLFLVCERLNYFVEIICIYVT